MLEDSLPNKILLVEGVDSLDFDGASKVGTSRTKVEWPETALILLRVTVIGGHVVKTSMRSIGTEFLCIARKCCGIFLPRNAFSLHTT